jgi:hypothetical protein
MIQRTENGKFAKGHSGNQSGKPKGTRNKATLLVLDLLEGESEALGRKAIELALAGDVTALRLCLERISPVSKERPLEAFSLPPITDQRNVLDALETIARKLSAGDLLPSESVAICRVLEQYRKHFETTELAERLAALERTLAVRGS